jgi:MoxR-like ATPase
MTEESMSTTPDGALPEPNLPPEMRVAPDEGIGRASDLLTSLRGEVRKAVLGQDEVVDQVLVALLSGGHVLLEGVPGLGKTLLVLALARAFGGKFSRIQFTPDLMPTDVTGHAMYDQKAGVFRIRKGPAFTNLLLADEINRAPAKTQAALLEVMQEQRITIEGDSMELSPPFMALATQNPIEQEGTYPLPEAQLDRFLLKVLIHYPSHEEETAIVGHVTTGKVGDALEVSAIRAVATPEDVVAAQAAASRVMVDERVVDYAVRIARATREWRGVRIGAGPRGGISLVRVARARALLDGRGYTLPDDVKAMVLPCLRHRIALAPELELEGMTPDDVLTALLAEVEAPRT